MRFRRDPASGVAELRDSRDHTWGHYQTQSGLKSGPFFLYYPDGKTFLESEWLLGQPHGRHRVWHPNGQLAQEGQFAAGQPAGTWTFWNEAGEMLRQENY